MTSIRIDERFCGPTGSGNGGYVAGRLAQLVAGDAVEVTLRAPPPLNRALTVRETERGLALMDGEASVAEAKPATLELDVPELPNAEDAAALCSHYTGFDKHAFPRCFVCGPERDAGDGLRIFPGRRPRSDGPVAAPFVPDAAFGEDGIVAPAVVWAALDCPGYFATAELGEVAVLGRMCAQLHRPVQVGESLVAAGFSLGRDGRKLHAGTALVDENGDVVARSRQVWIKL